LSVNVVDALESDASATADVLECARSVGFMIPARVLRSHDDRSRGVHDDAAERDAT
jgi:hypothetical protein